MAGAQLRAVILQFLVRTRCDHHPVTEWMMGHCVEEKELSYRRILLRLLSYLVFTRFAYASYLPYLYNRTVSTVYRTHFGLCRYLDT
jgi:hypothetical protein